MPDNGLGSTFSQSQDPVLRSGFQLVDPLKPVPALASAAILPVASNPAVQVVENQSKTLPIQEVQPMLTTPPVLVSQSLSSKVIQGQNNLDLVKVTTVSKTAKKQPLLGQEENPVTRSAFDSTQPLTASKTVGQPLNDQPQENKSATLKNKVVPSVPDQDLTKESSLESAKLITEVPKISQAVKIPAGSSDVIQTALIPVLETQISKGSTDVIQQAESKSVVHQPVPLPVLETRISIESKSVQQPVPVMKTKNTTPESSKVSYQAVQHPAIAKDKPAINSMAGSTCICRTKRQFYQFIQSKASPDAGTVQCTEKGCFCSCKLATPDQEKTSNPFSHLPEHLQNHFAVFQQWPFTQPGWGMGERRLGKRSSGTLHEKRSILKKHCSSKKCLEGLYGPHATPMIIHAFNISGLRLPTHLLHLANHVGSSRNGNNI